MSKVKIAINRHFIAWNKANPTLEPKPVISVKYNNGKGVDYTNAVTIRGKVEILYTPNTPISCGATVYITAYSEDIEITNPQSFKDVK